VVAGAADRAGASAAEVAGQSRRHARQLAITQRSEGGRGQLQPLLGGAQAFDRFAFEPAALAHLAARQGPLGQRVHRLGEAVEAIGGRSSGLQRCFGGEPLIPQQLKLPLHLRDLRLGLLLQRQGPGGPVPSLAGLLGLAGQPLHLHPPGGQDRSSTLQVDALREAQ
jgi:hypothetical protein